MLHYNQNVGVPWNSFYNKNWLPALIGAAATIGAGIIGHANANKASNAQSETNATNLQIARENNKANLDLWHEQSEYNSPENAMKRFRSAGINPFMAMSQITPGYAESAPSMQTPNLSPSYGSVAQAADAQALASFASAPQAAFAAEAQSNELDRQKYENQILKANAQYAEGMVFQQFMEQIRRNNLLDKQNHYQALQNFYFPRLSDMNLQQAEQSMNESNERILTMRVQRDVMEVSKRYNIALTAQVNQDISNSITQLSWNIREARSRISANYASSEQSLAAASVARETKKAVAEQVKLFKAETKKTLREAGLIPSGKKADSYINALVDKAWQDAEGSRQNAIGQKLRNKYESDWMSHPFGYAIGSTVQHMSPLGAFLR